MQNAGIQIGASTAHIQLISRDHEPAADALCERNRGCLPGFVSDTVSFSFPFAPSRFVKNAGAKSLNTARVSPRPEIVPPLPAARTHFALSAVRASQMRYQVQAVGGPSVSITILHLSRA